MVIFKTSIGGGLERTDCIPNRRVRLHYWRTGRTKYPFIVITPRSTLTESGSTCQGPIYESKRFFWKLLEFIKTVCKKKP